MPILKHRKTNRTDMPRTKSKRDFLLQPQSTPHALYPIHAKLEPKLHKEWAAFMKVETTELDQWTIGQFMDQARLIAHMVRIEYRQGDDEGWNVALAFKSRINVSDAELLVFHSKQDKDLWTALRGAIYRARTTTMVAD